MEELQKENTDVPRQVFRRIKILFPRSVWIVVFVVVGLPLLALTVGTAVFILPEDPDAITMLIILLILDFLVGMPLRAFIVGKVVVTPDCVMEQKIWDKRTVRRSDIARVVSDPAEPHPTLRLLNSEGATLLELDTGLYAWPRELAQALNAERPAE